MPSKGRAQQIRWLHHSSFVFVEGVSEAMDNEWMSYLQVLTDTIYIAEMETVCLAVVVQVGLKKLINKIK